MNAITVMRSRYGVYVSQNPDRAIYAEYEQIPALIQRLQEELERYDKETICEREMEEKWENLFLDEYDEDDPYGDYDGPDDPRAIEPYYNPAAEMLDD